MKPVLAMMERMRVRLGVPRLLWVLLWGLVPLATLPIGWVAARSLVGAELTWAQFVRRRLANVLLWTYVAVGSLIPTPFFGRLLSEARALAERLTGLSEESSSQPFRGIDSSKVPLVLALLTAVIYQVPDLRYGPWLVAVLLPFSFLGNVPTMAGTWFIVVLFLGLHRLGRLPLTLDSFTTDRSLGLRPFGRLAFWAFTPFVLFIAPLTLAGGRAPDLIFELGLLLVGTALFFLSLVGLHGQLLRAKARHLAWARSLYAEALAPVLGDASPTAGLPGGPGHALRTQSAELLAAAEVERRVAAIQEWPYDDGTLRTFAAITTSVAAAMVARVVLSRFGL